RAALKRRGDFSALVGTDSSLFCFENVESKAYGPGENALAVLWCPTPYAEARAKALGLPKVTVSPPLELLIEANDKTKLESWSLPCIPGRRVVKELNEALQLLSEETLRFKRPFGFAGRGHRRLTHQRSADDTRWLKDNLARHPLIAEPEIKSPKMFSLHMLVSREETLLGKPVGFSCDTFGSFANWNDSSLEKKDSDWMSSCALSSADALRKRGYLGPLSIDFARAYVGSIFALDLNARFSLGHRRGLPTLGKELVRLHREAAL